MSQANSRPAFLPLDRFANEDRLLSPEAQRRWLLALLILGLVLRLTRYLLRFPLWEDEASLSANFIDRGYLGLLEPLHYRQVAPVLFLWSQLTITRLFGFNEYVLRLVPFMAGVGSLFLFRHVAARFMQGISLVLAVGLFAVAYPMTRYAAEAKPYGCDLFVALAMLALTIEWLRRPGETRWLWCLAAMVGPAVGFSFPTIFIGGGISLVVGGMLLRSRLALRDASHLAEQDEYVKRRGWLAWIAFNAVLLAGVAATLWISRQAVGTVTQQNMEDDWGDMFPPIAHPLALPLWILKIHTGAMLGYPVGGPNWGSTFSFLCFAVGVGTSIARRKWLLLALLLAPLGLNFVAAALHRFPYGGHARMTLFLAPAFCTFIAYGLAAGLTHLSPKREWKGLLSHSLARPASIALALLALLGAGSWLRDVTQPYKSGTTLRAREFAQWFWFELPHDSELVSCETDLGTDLSPEKYNCGWSSLYLCNQRIYSPRHARGAKPDLSRISADHPLRCVLYRAPREEQESPSPDPQAREKWLAGMESRYDLAGHDTYPFAAYDKSDRRQISDDYVEVFKFVPKQAAVTLPSPWHHDDDGQYFPPGPQFPLSREAAAQKAASLEHAQQR